MLRGVLIVIALTAASCGVPSTFGVHSFHAHHPGRDLNLTGRVGTVDMSARSTFVYGGVVIERRAVSIDFTGGLGVRHDSFQSPTGQLESLGRNDSGGVYDAYATSVMVPFVRLPGLTIAGYGRASATGISRLIDRSSSKFGLEAGGELNFGATTVASSPYLRVGMMFESARIVLQQDLGFSNPAGDTSYTGLAVSLGIRVGK